MKEPGSVVYVSGNESAAEPAAVDELLNALVTTGAVAFEIRERVARIAEALFGHGSVPPQNDDSAKHPGVFPTALLKLREIQAEHELICRLLVGLEQECAINRDSR
jgi:hypothetical protein